MKALPPRASLVSTEKPAKSTPAKAHRQAPLAPKPPFSVIYYVIHCSIDYYDDIVCVSVSMYNCANQIYSLTNIANIFE